MCHFSFMMNCWAHLTGQLAGQAFPWSSTPSVPRISSCFSQGSQFFPMALLQILRGLHCDPLAAVCHKLHTVSVTPLIPLHNRVCSVVCPKGQSSLHWVMDQHQLRFGSLHITQGWSSLPWCGMWYFKI